MTGFLYAFDPSTKATGAAYFEDGKLVHVEVLEAKSLNQMLDKLKGWLLVGYNPTVPAVLEIPRTYPGSRVKTSSLLKITQVAGAIRAHFPTSKTYTPQQWNHSRPKKVTEERIKDLLSPSELAKVLAIRSAIRNNAYDAVGIGMHHLGKLK